MLGMMNAGGDTPADFFAPMRPSSLFRKDRYWKKAKETISYTSDGRLLVDGRPMAPEDPEELWSELIMRVIAYRLKQKIEKGKVVFFKPFKTFIPNTKTPSFWKRLSTKFVKRSVSVKDDLVLNAEYWQPPVAHEGFVTTIKVSPPSSPMRQKISFDGRRITT
uniref:Transposase n=1 Tax=Ascaris lumbricoides TaxID=6252 RepID=A0A0M3HTR3_ASCLU